MPRATPCRSAQEPLTSWMAMPPALAPGVYLEELSFHSKTIEGVATVTTGFIAGGRRRTVLGPITSFAEFLQAVGPNPSLHLVVAVRGFFANGGQICYLARIDLSDPLQLGLQGCGPVCAREFHGAYLLAILAKNKIVVFHRFMAGKAYRSVIFSQRPICLAVTKKAFETPTSG